MSDPAFFFTDKDGNRQDSSLHDELLNNPEVEEATSRAAIEREVGKGTSLEMAVALFGTPAIQKAFAEGTAPF